MAVQKISITIDAEVVAEARRWAGPGGLSRLIDTVLRQHLQGLRLRELEEELAARHGSIPEKVRRQVAEIEWPR